MALHKSVSLLSCLLLFTIYSKAQGALPHTIDVILSPRFNNVVKFSTGDFFVAGTGHTQQDNPFTQIGVYYERKIYKGLGIGVGYSKWQAWKLFSESNGIFLGELVYPPTEVGKLYERIGYKMVDIYAFYKKQIWPKHILNASIGTSYCWGINTYLIFPDPSPSDDQIIFLLGEGKAMYWGGIASLGYDYIVRKRYSIGLNLRERVYNGRDKAQFDYSLHLGVRF